MTEVGRQPDRLHELRSAIAENTVPGGSAFGRAAAEVIALTLQHSDASDAELSALLSTTSGWLVEAKPSMTSVRTVAELATRTLSETGSREAVISAMKRFIADSEASIARIADHAESYIPSGAKVLFHSFSGSLVNALQRAARTRSELTLMFTESRPYRESRRIASALADTPARMVAFSDAAMAAAAAEADLVLVGADALFRDGSFANKIGSLPLALSCRHTGTPYYVLTELSKLYPGDPDDVAMEQRPPAEMADDWELWTSGRVVVRNQFFERVPAELVTAYLTDEGAFTPHEVADLARVRATTPSTTQGNASPSGGLG
jgi:translation initiation factor 2B subunit (eIF-2B alpha/beta/delta family)